MDSSANAGLEEEDLEGVSGLESFAAVQQMKPEICIEWSNVRVSFRVLSDASGSSEDQDYFEIYPKIDPNAPSSKTLSAQRRRLKDIKNPMTLSNLIGGGNNGLAGTNGLKISSWSSSSANETSEEGGGGEIDHATKKCHICGRTFNKSTYLKRHLLSHSSVKPYKCNVCNWGFYQHCNLKRHMLSHSLGNGSEGFKCQHCKASFTTKSVLSVHMRDAHGDKLMTKKEQQQNCRNGGTLKSTMIPNVKSAAASNLKPLSGNAVSSNGWSRCQACNKNFLTLANLKQHMLLHEGRKPFKCNFCNLRFSQKPTLKKHLLKHTAGSGGHPCPNCSIHFRTREDLAQHIVCQHPLTQLDSSTNSVGASNSSIMPFTGPREDEEEEEEEIPAPINVRAASVTSHTSAVHHPFSCSICSATFDKVAMLNRHINQQHSVIGNPTPTPPALLNQ